MILWCTGCCSESGGENV